MDMLRMRISGPRPVVNRLIELLGAIEGVERAEVIDDLMPKLDDDDSSSAGLAENHGDDVAHLEIDAEDESTLQEARETALEGARRAGLALEIVDEF